MLKKFVKKLNQPTINEIRKLANSTQFADEAVAQKVAVQQYRLIAKEKPELLPKLNEVGFRKYSQFEEDGILLYIFSLLDTISRTCVEICAGNGRQCNTSNLIINHGWWGHLFDGDRHNVEDGMAFFSKHPDTFLYPPRFSEAWITAENVNELIAASGLSGKIDLLSIDVDGVDYWIWKAIRVIDPTVVVCETHNPIPPERALTVPYDPEFIFESENYRGASLAAMCKLGKEKGYRLVGTHRFGFNAFFIKEGIGEAYFPEVDVASCMQDPFSKLARKERWPLARKEDWQEV